MSESETKTKTKTKTKANEKREEIMNDLNNFFECKHE
jgi:hypothetical protein